MSLKYQSLVAIIVSSILWGTAGVVGKILMQNLHPFVASFYRYLIASIIILPFFIKEKKLKQHLKNTIFLSFLPAFNVLLFYFGLTTTTANSATLIYGATPLAVVVLAYFLFKEKLKTQKVIGILLGFAGIIGITILPLIENNTLVGDFKGNLLIAFGMTSWALYTVLSRNYLSKHGYSPVSMTAFNFFITTLLSLCFALSSGISIFHKEIFSPFMFSMLIYSGIFITFFTYLLYQWAMKHISASSASLKHYMEPVVAVFLNTIILKEQITAGFVLGSLLVLFGVIVALYGFRENPKSA